MISKATGWQGNLNHTGKAHLTSAMRAVINWATIEEHDSVLDLNCRDGALLNSLKKHLRLNTCGLCPLRDKTRLVREANDGSDIVYALPHDIPWRNDAFDCVLSSELISKDKLPSILSQTKRVLRPGGHIVMLTKAFDTKDDIIPGRREIMRSLQEAGFESVSWRHSGFFGIAIAWKSIS